MCQECDQIRALFVSRGTLRAALIENPPGAKLQNDLDPIVKASNGQVRHGNMGTSKNFDRVNNFEQVVWENISAGNVTSPSTPSTSPSSRSAMGLRLADQLILVRSARAGERVMRGITRYLETSLKLKVNPAKSKVAPMSECSFLSFTIKGNKIRWTDRALADTLVLELDNSRQTRESVPANDWQSVFAARFLNAHQRINID